MIRGYSLFFYLVIWDIVQTVRKGPWKRELGARVTENLQKQFWDTKHEYRKQGALGVLEC